MQSLIPSLLSAAATLLVCLINNHYQMQMAEKKHGETIAIIQYKIDDLTDKVNKHNNLIERTYELERQQALTDEKMKVANHRIDDLEKTGGVSGDK